MKNLFDDFHMAEGYANARPPLHPLIIERLQIKAPVNLAVDLGCGAGLSTVALSSISRNCLGFDPSEAMVKAARHCVPAANFFVASAEAIPLSSQQVDLISAAGSLNYVDLAQFFAEARRILRPKGIIAVYDFSPGNSFASDVSLGNWFSEFSRRYPWPAFNGRGLNPAILSSFATGFQLEANEHFAIPLPMMSGDYLNYMMTETNVAQAIAHGTTRESIRNWCAESIGAVFAGKPQQVLFKGYFACLNRANA